MPRPNKLRRIYGEFGETYFKPRGVAMVDLKEIVLEADELEAIRLSDLEDRYQNDAAELMGVSRQTFGNIIKRARQKIADALINGKAIKITPVMMERKRCRGCGRRWSETSYAPKDEHCPVCESPAVETEAAPSSNESSEVDS